MGAFYMWPDCTKRVRIFPAFFIGCTIEARTIHKRISMKMTEIITNHTIDRRLLYTRMALRITRKHFFANNKKPRNVWYQHVSRFLAEKEGVEPSRG